MSLASGNTTDLVEESNEVRRSDRDKKLSQKAKENAGQEVIACLTKMINKQSTENRNIEKVLENVVTKVQLKQIGATLSTCMIPIHSLYDELRDLVTSVPKALCQDVDRLSGDVQYLNEIIDEKLEGFSKSQTSSICSHTIIEAMSFKSAKSMKSNKSSISNSSKSSVSSVRSLLKVIEADAEKTKAALDALIEQDKLDEEMRHLELQEATRKLEIEKKRKEVEKARLRKVLAIDAEKAKALREELPPETSGLMHTVGSSPQHLLPVSSAIPRGVSEPIVGAEPSTRELVKAMTSSMVAARYPAPKPPVFKGDPLNFRNWEIAFKHYIEGRESPDNEKMYFLQQFVDGEAKNAIAGFALLTSHNAYLKAMTVLKDRFGRSSMVTNAYRDQLEMWPKIPGNDYKAMREYSDFLNQCLAAKEEISRLTILDDEKENRKFAGKLPDYVTKKWAQVIAKAKRKDVDYPSFAKFVEFVQREAENLFEVTNLTIENKTTKDTKDKAKVKRFSTVLKTEASSAPYSTSNCKWCEKPNHSTADCFALAKLSPGELNKAVREMRLCFRCLKGGHMEKDCKANISCKKCAKNNHVTANHEEEHVPAVQDNNNSNEKQVSTITCGKIEVQGSNSFTAGMIVPVWVSHKNNPHHEILTYALLDTQSSSTFMSDELCERLGCPHTSTKLQITTLTSRKETVDTLKVSNLQIRGYKEDKAVSLPPTFTRQYIPFSREHIPTRSKVRAWPHLHNVSAHLEDLLDCEAGLLIGYDCPSALAPLDAVHGEGNVPFAVKTDLGWSVVGTANNQEHADALGVHHRILTRELHTSHISLRCNADIKELSPSTITSLLEGDFLIEKEQPKMSQEDFRFLEILSKGIHKDTDGAISMPLPFKEKPPCLDTRGVALKRLHLLQRKLTKDETYRAQYTQFMQTMLENQEAELVPEQELNNPSWYIPHFGVFHPKKPDKIRVVFDASTKCSGTSLNDYLLQGPDLINSLFGVLVRFRQHPVALMCDIERMFYKFRVHQADRDFLRFLWWTPDGQIADYRMKVHIFGATSSPGCATYGLRHLAQIAKGSSIHSKKAADFITHNFYVDDGLVSVATAEEAINLVQASVEICGQGGIRLHKFASNSDEVVCKIPVSERAANKLSLEFSSEPTPIHRALGIEWCTKTDTFQFKVHIQDTEVSRRSLLSTVASLYDPLGLLAPLILNGKKILQQMCREGAGWDDPLPVHLGHQWDEWKSDLLSLNSLKIKRCLAPIQATIVKQELHHFSDASDSGYGTCSYLRSIDDTGKAYCSLVCGKARVAPLKAITIPRAELQAAVLSAKIGSCIREALNFQGEEYYWTDSKIVLGYVHNEQKRFHVYVANRVREIHTRSNKNSWRHVVSEENPADIASRGASYNELANSDWFDGPSFLWHEALPEDEISFTVDTSDPEVKATTLITVLSPGICTRFTKFSSWKSLVTAITTLRKLIVLKTKIRSLGTFLEERQRSEVWIITMAQAEDMDEKLSRSLKKLNLRKDERGLLRVGGRLEFSSTIDEALKHPIILPRKCFVTQLIIKHCHEAIKHQGRGMTLAKVRSDGYWVVGGSRMVSSLIHNCVVCRRGRSSTAEQMMAPLPPERLTSSSPPFTFVGCDCFGPFLAKDGRKESKRWGLVFTCMNSRAVHIEVLEDMSSDAFINALRALIAIRGPIRQLRSDCGTNFVGAYAELTRMLQNINDCQLQSFLKEQSCEYITNPPGASHMGGAWERQIRTIRSILSNLLVQHQSRLTTSGLRTLLYEAMAIVNSRPLSVEGITDPEVIPLNPNMIITMKTGITSQVPGKFEPEDVYSRKRWIQVQALAEAFWKRWMKEYLVQLQQRQKWCKVQDNVQVGDVVLVMMADQPRGSWPLGRVTQAITSKDGLVRKVHVRMGTKGAFNARTTLERPISKIVFLLRP